MKNVELFKKLLAEVYQPTEVDNCEVVMKTSADLRNDFSGFVDIGLVDIGYAMQSMKFRFVTMDHKPFWLLYSKKEE